LTSFDCVSKYFEGTLKGSWGRVCPSIDLVCFGNIFLILMALITGNSSLEPLLEVLLAEIHIDLS